MPTFTEKSKAAQQTTLPKSSFFSRVHIGQNHDRNSIPNLQRMNGTTPAETNWAAAESGIRSTSHPLPYLDTIQTFFGHYDISRVQAHTNAVAAQAIGARAYTTNGHVVFARKPDLRTAAHEATHVVQQHAGVRLENGLGQTGDVYEQHADRVVDAVVTGRSAEQLLDTGPGSTGTHGWAIQRQTPPGLEAPKETSEGKELRSAIFAVAMRRLVDKTVILSDEKIKTVRDKRKNFTTCNDFAYQVFAEVVSTKYSGDSEMADLLADIRVIVDKVIQVKAALKKQEGLFNSLVVEPENMYKFKVAKLEAVKAVIKESKNLIEEIEVITDSQKQFDAAIEAIEVIDAIQQLIQAITAEKEMPQEEVIKALMIAVIILSQKKLDTGPKEPHNRYKPVQQLIRKKAQLEQQLNLMQTRLNVAQDYLDKTIGPDKEKRQLDIKTNDDELKKIHPKGDAYIEADPGMKDGGPEQGDFVLFGQPPDQTMYGGRPLPPGSFKHICVLDNIEKQTDGKDITPDMKDITPVRKDIEVWNTIDGGGTKAVKGKYYIRPSDNLVFASPPPLLESKKQQPMTQYMLLGWIDINKLLENRKSISETGSPLMKERYDQEQGK